MTFCHGKHVFSRFVLQALKHFYNIIKVEALAPQTFFFCAFINKHESENIQIYSFSE